MEKITYRLEIFDQVASMTIREGYEFVELCLPVAFVLLLSCMYKGPTPCYSLVVVACCLEGIRLLV